MSLALPPSLSRLSRLRQGWQWLELEVPDELIRSCLREVVAGPQETVKDHVNPSEMICGLDYHLYWRPENSRHAPA